MRIHNYKDYEYTTHLIIPYFQITIFLQLKHDKTCRVDCGLYRIIILILKTEVDRNQNYWNIIIKGALSLEKI